jgi:hypothetical protein
MNSPIADDIWLHNMIFPNKAAVWTQYLWNIFKEICTDIYCLSLDYAYYIIRYFQWDLYHMANACDTMVFTHRIRILAILTIVSTMSDVFAQCGHDHQPGYYQSNTFT